MKKIAIIEDDIELKELLTKFINHEEEYECVLSVESVEEFLKYYQEFDKLDLIITDIGLPGMSGVEGIQIFKNIFPNINILVLTVHDNNDYVFQSLCYGASAYILKNSPLSEIKNSIDITLSGGSIMSPRIARKVVDYFNKNDKTTKTKLTSRESDVVAGLVDGLSYKLIADRYTISIDTVRQHIRNIYKKLNVNCKAEVISKYFKGEI